MEIAIKSETDSRILVYPLIKTLHPYGTVAVYTSNKYMSRLIENSLEGGFKNVRIVVSPEADLESCKESDEYYLDKYDFLIMDNVGAIDYDLLLCIITNRLSESFVNDLVFIAAEDKTRILKFGSPAPALKDASKKGSTKKKKKGEEGESEEEEPASGDILNAGGTVEEQQADVDDQHFNKWRYEKTDEDVLRELLASKDIKWCKFPSFEGIELMESRHNMMCPDDTLIKELYKIFGEKLAINERQFTKGAKVKDESGSDISGTDVR